MLKAQRSGRPRYVVIGTNSRGGVRTVIESYEDIGFHRNADYYFILSHVEGPVPQRLYHAAKAGLQLLYALVIRRCDFVHAHASMNGSFWRKALYAALTLGIGRGFILHIHGSEFRVFYESLPRPGRYLARYTLARATRVIVLSEYWKHFVEGLGCENALVIPNWVMDKHGAQPISAQRNSVLFLGEVGQRKGSFDLIRAYRILADVHGMHALPKLYIAGNGQNAEARALVRESSLADAVEVVGWASGETLERLFSACGIFVLPSYNEGLPMAILEAMNAGMAIVSTPVGGIPDVLNATNGVLVPPGDTDKLAEGLARLIFHPERRKAMAEAARSDYYRFYTAEQATRKMQEVYVRMLADPGVARVPGQKTARSRGRTG